jgi:phage shock protein A
MVLQKRLEAEHRRMKDKAEQWEDRATRAVKMGDDDLARQCLQQKVEADRQAKELGREVENQQVYVSNLTSAAKALEARARAVKLRQSTLGRRSGELSSSRPFSELSRFEDRIEAEAAEVELEGEIGAGGRALDEARLERKLEKLERESAADEELRRLKEKTGSANNRKHSEKDEALDDELELIRQQLSSQRDEIEDPLEELKRKLDDDDSKGTRSSGV